MPRAALAASLLVQPGLASQLLASRRASLTSLEFSRHHRLLYAAIIALEEIRCCLAGTPIGGLQFRCVIWLESCWPPRIPQFS